MCLTEWGPFWRFGEATHEQRNVCGMWMDRKGTEIRKVQGTFKLHRQINLIKPFMCKPSHQDTQTETRA